ncbi:NADPH2:quinone reductase [Actinokineospora alba]|uniref:NADPH2:quinone reductase n=1 Tax=Actinokineospora alba TaxID=504798 RepID=A0A1H0VTF5_9PSEU|nr:quinone oxidoreductase [Actinokineospora alba]TDP70087.1 NADPH:quinone reductase-like Zn-dependent oxidoreductase [Actinokineospora alba]SDI39325.1 NADPH2:quinone reductase [Actinokineospora alba]SDP81852.1 NADPH2:quinone reductase [Actinokineospora alba]
MTKAVVVTRTGGPEVLTYADREIPTPGPGEALVRVTAAGVNYIDTYHREGIYTLPLPFGLGLEGAGTITAVGDDVGDLAVGDRVAWADALGSYAEHVLVKATAAVRVPDGVDDETAAAAMLQGLTAHYLVTSTYPARPVDTVLVHAAAGGVGLLLVQLAKARGARVIGTVSTSDKEALAREAGADEVIRYTEEDFAARTLELTDGEGVAAVYDGVGRTTFDGSLSVVKRRGTMALFGAASGPVAPVDPQRLNSGGSLFLTRPKLADHVATEEELRWRADELFGSIVDGSLKVRIGGRYPLAEARQAHEDLQGRRTTGKLLLIP